MLFMKTPTNITKHWTKIVMKPKKRSFIKELRKVPRKWLFWSFPFTQIRCSLVNVWGIYFSRGISEPNKLRALLDLFWTGFKGPQNDNVGKMLYLIDSFRALDIFIYKNKAFVLVFNMAEPGRCKNQTWLLGNFRSAWKGVDGLESFRLEIQNLDLQPLSQKRYY